MTTSSTGSACRRRTANPDDQITDNTAAPPGALAGTLTGPTTTAGGREDDFYGRYAAEAGKPLLIDTAARYVPGRPGRAEVDVKRSWWAQAVGAATASVFPGPADRGVAGIDHR